MRKIDEEQALTVKGRVVNLHCATQTDREGKLSKVFSAGRLQIFQFNGRKTDGEQFISFAGSAYCRLGDLVTFVGYWDDHPKYGRQLKVVNMLYEMAVDAEGLAQWLAMHPEAKGIGLVKARKIAEKFGEDFCRVLAEEPERIAEVANIPLENVQRLATNWIAHQEFNAVAVSLAKWDLTRFQIEKLVNKFGGRVVAVVEENPYLLMGEIHGFGFRRIDDIARKVGIPKVHPGRIRAGIMDVIGVALDDGSTCVEHSVLLTSAMEKLVLDCIEAERLVLNGMGEIEAASDARVYYFGCDGESEKKYYAAHGIGQREEFVWEFLRRGLDPNPVIPSFSVAKLVQRFGDVHELDDSQREAIAAALTFRMCVITGGAGSGKTTSIKAIVDSYLNLGKTIALCAPTGKAARRMEQVIGKGLEAKTIHRLLEYKPGWTVEQKLGGYKPGWSFERNSENPLEADVVIVDEVSMVDIKLAYHLFRAITRGTAVILVGDHHQLPPVGPGALLRDCFQRDLVPVAHLRHCHRQAGPLKMNSNLILSGHVERTVLADPGERSPWYVQRAAKTTDDVLGALERIFCNHLASWGIDPLLDCQFLSPIHKGDLGTKAVNIMLQKLYQKSKGVEVEPVKNDEHPTLYLGDKVINTRNNYDLEIMNGHQGRVVSATPLIVDFDGRQVAIPKQCEGEILLAYCLTPHKCQGSEWKVIVTICSRSHSQFTYRNWLYTAVTRAKEISIIVGDAWGIDGAAMREREDKRQTLLSLFEKD